MKTHSYPAIRSLFFAPGNRPDLVAKFPRFGADCCVIDLEDGTPPDEKTKARDMLPQTVAGVRAAGLKSLLFVRVNVPDSPHYLADIAAAFSCDVDGIVIPKLESPAQAFPALHWINRLDAEQPRALPRRIVGGLESVKGTLNAVQICTAFSVPLTDSSPPTMRRGRARGCSASNLLIQCSAGKACAGLSSLGMTMPSTSQEKAAAISAK